MARIKGYHHSEETKKKIGFSKIGNKNLLGFKFSKESKKKMRKAKIGKKLSKKHIENISKALQGRKYPPRPKEWRENIKKSLTGRKLSKEHREAIKRGNARLSGKDHPMWKGGTSFEPYSIDWTETLRKAIRERDHYLCQNCLQYGNIVHHIDGDKKNCSLDNLITLCRSCHSKTIHDSLNFS